MHLSLGVFVEIENPSQVARRSAILGNNAVIRRSTFGYNTCNTWVTIETDCTAHCVAVTNTSHEVT